MSSQSCFGCVFLEEAAAAQAYFSRALAGDQRPFDFRLRSADGSPVWVSISCMPMCDEAGATVALLGLFSDISERKRAGEALRKSEKLLRNLLESLPEPEKMATFYSLLGELEPGVSGGER